MKFVLILVVLAILGVGAYFVLGGPAVEPVLAPSGETVGEQTTPEAPVDSVGGPVTVTLTESGFSPETVTVNVGDTVRFVNNSSRNMWVGADEHPSHTQYDGTSRKEHCATMTSFDQCVGTAQGTSWEFTFDKAGTFDYHNHVEASDTGTVVVK